MDDTHTRMIVATAALATVAAMLVGAAGASVAQGHGVRSVASQSETRQGRSPVAVVPYLSHGLGVDQTRFSGQTSRSLGGGSAPAPQTIPYLSQGVGVDASQFAGQAAPTLDRHESIPVGSRSLGLTGDSPLGRVVAHEPAGLTGDSALTRIPGAAPAIVAVSGGNDVDWTSFGAGAGMVALIAAGLVGTLLSARRRRAVGTP
jgi:F0F1-type ATP synthase membrane subunit c/vacuolar-type H+-ATPase subunit K